MFGVCAFEILKKMSFEYKYMFDKIIMIFFVGFSFAEKMNASLIIYVIILIGISLPVLLHHVTCMYL